MLILGSTRHHLYIELLGWGLLSRFTPFLYFPKFSALSKHTLIIRYYIPLSSGDTCQIWTWFKVSNLLSFVTTTDCIHGIFIEQLVIHIYTHIPGAQLWHLTILGLGQYCTCWWSTECDKDAGGIMNNLHHNICIRSTLYNLNDTQ